MRKIPRIPPAVIWWTLILEGRCGRQTVPVVIAAEQDLHLPCSYGHQTVPLFLAVFPTCTCPNSASSTLQCSLVWSLLGIRRSAEGHTMHTPSTEIDLQLGGIFSPSCPSYSRMLNFCATHMISNIRLYPFMEFYGIFFKLHDVHTQCRRRTL